MISAELRKLLIAQIGNELAAHQLYIGDRPRTSSARASTAGASSSATSRSRRPSTPRRIMDFLTDNEVEFDLPALKATSTRFGSALAAAQRALESERAVAAQFDRMAAVARLERRPPRPPVPPVVHRGAGRGGGEDPAHRRPHRQRASTCSRPRPCSSQFE